MTKQPLSTPSLDQPAFHGGRDDSSNLGGKTLRTVAVLVGSCVLFVGALSTAAVLITSKAVSGSPSASEVRDTTAMATKKPTSI